MTTIWKTAQLIALHRLSKGIPLTHYLKCFAAGYNRGIDDVSKSVPSEEWTRLVSQISHRMVGDHSALEAGCWLAGVHSGRADAEGQKVPLHSPDFQEQLHRRFCESWETGCIAQRALECDPSAVRFSRTFATLFVAGEIPGIAGQLQADKLS